MRPTLTVQRTRMKRAKGMPAMMRTPDAPWPLKMMEQPTLATPQAPTLPLTPTRPQAPTMPLVLTTPQAPTMPMARAKELAHRSRQ